MEDITVNCGMVALDRVVYDGETDRCPLSTMGWGETEVALWKRLYSVIYMYSYNYNYIFFCLQKYHWSILPYFQRYHVNTNAIQKLWENEVLYLCHIYFIILMGQQLKLYFLMSLLFICIFLVKYKSGWYITEYVYALPGVLAIR